MPGAGSGICAVGVQWASRRLAAFAGQDGESPGVAADGGRGQRVRRGIEVAKGKYAGSPAGHLWHRLDATDFINRDILFAVTLFLCFFPFLIVANAVVGIPRMAAAPAAPRSAGCAAVRGDRLVSWPSALSSALPRVFHCCTWSSRPRNHRRARR